MTQTGMTETDVVHALGRSPIETLSGRWGEAVAKATRELERVTSTLAELDKITEQLRSHGVTVCADLGVVGNAAAEARRTGETTDKAVARVRERATLTGVRER